MKLSTKRYNELLKELNAIWALQTDTTYFVRVINSHDNKRIYRELGIKIFRGAIPISESMQVFINRMDDAQKTHYLLAIGQTAKLLRSLHRTEAVLFVYKAIDQFQRKTASGDITCKKGCSFCCYQQVIVNAAEGDVISEYLGENPNDVDMEQLKIHRGWALHSVKDIEKNKGGAWNSPQIDSKRCPMLSSKGLCRIYELRPMTCRIHQVTNDPQNCNSELYPNGIIEAVNHLELATLVTATMQNEEFMPLAHGVKL